MKSSRTKLQIGLWIGSIFMVILIGLRYMPHEPDHPDFWETLYSTLRLFVFERDLPTFPRTPPLIFIYFAAPLITASAIGAAISYLFSISPMLRTRWMSDHVIVCGVGRTGKIVIQTLKEKKVPVIGIDIGPAELFEEWRRACKAAIVFGDFHLKQILDKVGISRARSVIFAAGDDLANLEGALAAYECMRSESGPVRLIWAHIANEKLAHTARLAMRTKGKTGIRFFDTYHIAAEKIIAKYFNRELRNNIREVNIIGFGKFGRDLFDVLINDMGADEKMAIRVIDKQNRKHSVANLAKEFGVSDRVEFIHAEIQELELIDQPDKAFFICTDDDLGNLTAAMSLSNKTTDRGNIYVRMARWPLTAVTVHFGADRGVIFVNINDLMEQGIEQLPGILSCANERDLKRLEN